jgi:thiamine biosynthesis lipoprotein
MKSWLMLRLLAALLCVFTSLLTKAQLKRFEFTQNKMGSPFHLIFYHNDTITASLLAKECYLIVDSLNAIFSDYDPDSEVGTLALSPGGTNLPVSNELYEMLKLSRAAWHKSSGAFDITIGPLTRLWRKARSEKRFPLHSEIMSAQESTGMNQLVIDSLFKKISFKVKGMSLDFGGIVKGYAAQRMVDYLRSRDVAIALADAGGDIAVGESPPGKSGWRIAVSLPGNESAFFDKELELTNVGVATSGDIYNYIIHDGKKYSHIVDPRTGYGVTSQRTVTVIAKDGTNADWLATACSILSINDALELAGREHAELLITIFKDGKLATHKTKNFDRYFRKG